VTDGCVEDEGLHIPSVEQPHLVIPVGDGSFPVSGRKTETLLVNVQVLTNTPTIYAPALSAIVVEDTLVGVALSHCCQLIVPFHHPHV